MTQQELSKLFEDSQKSIQEFGEPLANGWGSARHGDKDGLWDTNTDTHYERNHPDGAWEIVPPINQSEIEIPQQKSYSAKQAAEDIYKWSLATGLLHSEHLSIADVEAIDTDDLFPLSAVEILRKKKVRHIAYNDAEDSITIFLQRAIGTNKSVLNALPMEIGGIRIKYRQGITQTIGQHVSLPHSAAPWTIRQSSNGSGYYACGSSISVGNSREAGTLGAIVKDADGKLYGLSNNHVSGSCNYASKGLPIVAPGILDVCANGLHPFTIGTHSKLLELRTGSPDHVPAAGNIDAAIFELTFPDKITSWQGNSYDTPAAAANLEAGMIVEKVGRTTGSTQGKVMGKIYGFQSIMYNAPLYQFSGLVYFTELFAIIGHGDMFSDSGDSGSLITNVDPNGNRNAVGIVVGGMEDGQAPGGKITLALPIIPVLNELGVTLVSGLNP